MKRAWLGVLWLSAVGSAWAAPAPSAAEKQAMSAVTPAMLRGHVRFLSSDLLEGRGPATQGDLLAQQYIAAQFEAIGLKPGAPGGGWFQRFDIVGVNGAPKEMTVAAAGQKSFELKGSDDFIAVSGTEGEDSRLDA